MSSKSLAVAAALLTLGALALGSCAAEQHPPPHNLDSTVLIPGPPLVESAAAGEGPGGDGVTVVDLK